VVERFASTRRAAVLDACAHGCGTSSTGDRTPASGLAPRSPRPLRPGSGRRSRWSSTMASSLIRPWHLSGSRPRVAASARGGTSTGSPGPARPRSGWCADAVGARRWPTGTAATAGPRRPRSFRRRSLLQGDSLQTVGTLLHTLLGDRWTQHVAQQRLPARRVERARARGRVQGEPIERGAQRLVVDERVRLEGSKAVHPLRPRRWCLARDCRSGNMDLLVLETRTGALRQLTDDPAQDWDPGFKPDGRHLLWSSASRPTVSAWSSRRCRSTRA